jgi:uncharacterized protein GlcG (DUF336 family)
MNPATVRHAALAAVLFAAFGSVPLLANNTATTQAQPQAQTYTITLEQAKRAVNAAVSAAQKLNVSASVAVLDAGGNLIALERMDGAILGSLDGAVMKGYTSVVTGGATKDLKGLVQPGAPLHGLETARFAKPTIFLDGGLPVRSGERLVGAVGVGGGSLEQDQRIAEAARTALGIR